MSAQRDAASRRDLTSRRLYLCTPDRPDLLEFVEACIDGGVDVVQLRDKVSEARVVVARGRELQELCAEREVPFILNDRPDLALDIGCDGVHLGQDDATPLLARRILGSEVLVGLSTHSPDDIGAAKDEPVDYVSAGPVSPTPTKPGRPGTGLGYVTHAVGASSRPVFVTGGVSPFTAAEMVDAGARHFVVVRYLTDSSDPRRDATRLREAIDVAIESLASTAGVCEADDGDGTSRRW